METTFTTDWATHPVPKNKAELQEAINSMLQEIERANARMDRNRSEIDRLEAETQATLANISRLLAS